MTNPILCVFEAGSKKCGRVESHDHHRCTIQFKHVSLMECHPWTPSAETPRPGKYPIDRPCSACSAGDTTMEYHDHYPPFRKGFGPAEPAETKAGPPDTSNGYCLPDANGHIACDVCRDDAEGKKKAEPVASVSPPQRFYVASRASIPERAKMWRYWRSEGVRIVSSWIDESGVGETADFGELWARIEAEIRSADCLVLYAESGDFPLKGAFVEVGMALAMGKPVRVVAWGVELAPRDMKPLGSWAKHPRVKRFGNLSEAFEVASASPELARHTDDPKTCPLCVAEREASMQRALREASPVSAPSERKATMENVFAANIEDVSIADLKALRDRINIALGEEAKTQPESTEQLVIDLARELYDRFVMGGWESQDAYGQIREMLRRNDLDPRTSGERWLARRGFADSRTYSAAELGPLLEEFWKEVKAIQAREPVETHQAGLADKGKL